jgi:hypothetical protein
MQHYLFMQKVNVQIRVTAQLADEIERLADVSKSDFVRKAIEEKIQREKSRRLEEQWIEGLHKNPESTKESDDWLKAEAWDEQ